MSRNVHLVDDSVSREVIFVEGPVKTDSGDVTRTDKGADAGTLLENNIMITNINLRRMMIDLRHCEAGQRPLRSWN